MRVTRIIDRTDGNESDTKIIISDDYAPEGWLDLTINGLGIRIDYEDLKALKDVVDEAMSAFGDV